MKTVTVKFNDYNGKTYDYVVSDDTEVSMNDYAVAHNGSNFALVNVVDIRAGISAKANKALFVVLNKQMREEYEKNNAFVREQKELYNRLDQLVEREYENNKYRVLAASNAEAAEILAKLGIK
jgi:hypothetical protein